MSLFVTRLVKPVGLTEHICVGVVVGLIGAIVGVFALPLFPIADGFTVGSILTSLAMMLVLIVAAIAGLRFVVSRVGLVERQPETFGQSLISGPTVLIVSFLVLVPTVVALSYLKFLVFG